MTRLQVLGCNSGIKKTNQRVMNSDEWSNVLTANILAMPDHFFETCLNAESESPSPTFIRKAHEWVLQHVACAYVHSCNAKGLLPTWKEVADHVRVNSNICKRDANWKDTMMKCMENEKSFRRFIKIWHLGRRANGQEDQNISTSVETLALKVFCFITRDQTFIPVQGSRKRSPFRGSVLGLQRVFCKAVYPRVDPFLRTPFFFGFRQKEGASDLATMAVVCLHDERAKEACDA